MKDKNKYNELGLSDSTNEAIRDQFWKTVEELSEKTEPHGKGWRGKAHDLAIKYRACLTCLEKGDDWNLYPETLRCKKCHELKGMKENK